MKTDDCSLTTPAQPGLLTYEDMAGYCARIEPAVTYDYHGAFPQYFQHLPPSHTAALSHWLLRPSEHPLCARAAAQHRNPLALPFHECSALNNALSRALNGALGLVVVGLSIDRLDRRQMQHLVPGPFLVHWAVGPRVYTYPI